MSNLNNITNKILEEANSQKEEILKSAKNLGEKIVADKTEEARLLEKQILDKAEVEGASIKDRIVSRAKLKVKNDKLEAKQKVIDEVFQLTLLRLSSMDEEDYQKYIINSITQMDITGEESLILSANYIQDLNNNNALIDEINRTLKGMGKKGNIKLSQEFGDFMGGFMLEKDGIAINNTFEALVNNLRDKMEYDIAKVLFDMEE